MSMILESWEYLQISFLICQEYDYWLYEYYYICKGIVVLQLAWWKYKGPKSPEILVFVCFQKDVRQYCITTKFNHTHCAGRAAATIGQTRNWQRGDRWVKKGDDYILIFQWKKYLENNRKLRAVIYLWYGGIRWTISLKAGARPFCVLCAGGCLCWPAQWIQSNARINCKMLWHHNIV